MDADHIRELFSEFGVVQIRRMFGGAGIYAGEVMFGLVADDLIYLKADEGTVPAFERERCAPFQYATKNGKRAVMSYWRVPDRLYDDPEELAQWARRALAVAHNGPAARPGSPARERAAAKRRKPNQKRR